MMSSLQRCKSWWLVFVLMSLASHVECRETQNPESLGKGRLVFERRPVAIQVEIADTAEERAVGLMHRDELAADAGMLFVFPNEAIRGVWMKNTHIPLDILFISAEGRIVSLLQHVSPCVTADCEVYHSAVPARYMLEVNAGFIDHWLIELGDKVSVFVQR